MIQSTKTKKKKRETSKSRNNNDISHNMNSRNADYNQNENAIATRECIFTYYTHIQELLIFIIQFYTLLILITIGSKEYSPPTPAPVPVLLFCSPDLTDVGLLHTPVLIGV